jgi:hypothetical protein
MKLMAPIVAALLLSGTAQAADLHCTDADKSSWLPAAQVQKMLRDHGFADVGAVQTTPGNCYAVPVTDQSGAKKTTYLDPTDGALMGLE